MNETKERIIALLKSTERAGIDGLIEYMAEKSDFFNSPCSGQYHLCKEGGLAEHSLNVYEFGYDHLPSIIGKDIIGWYSWTIVSLLHDLGKATYYEKPNFIPNILKSGKQSEDRPYLTNSDRCGIPHEIASLHIASQYIELTEDEATAIVFHNGLYTPLGNQIKGKETQLQQLLHFSDMYCSRFIEGGNE